MSKGSPTRQAAEIAKLLRSQGVRVKETKNGYMAYPPDRSRVTVGWHRSPSDHRWHKNLLAALRRSGIDPYV